MLLNPLTLYLPKTALEASSLFKKLPDAKVLAGGTFLLNALKLMKTKGNHTPSHLLSLAKLKELRGISFQENVLTIRAMTRVNDIYHNPLVKEHLKLLCAVCQNISTNPIRNMATIGGNLTCRYTWTEMGAVMVALDAGMHFLQPDGQEQVISAEDFFKNAAHSEHLLVYVTIPVAPQVKVAYRRVKKTLHVDVPLLAVCVKTQLKGKQWYNTRVGINNGVGFAQRDYALEDFLNKSAQHPTLGQEALEHLTKSIYDTRSSEYKQRMFRVSLASAIEEIGKLSGHQ